MIMDQRRRNSHCLHFYFIGDKAHMVCRHRPTTLKHNHAIYAILRSIQEIIKMHALFYVNGVVIERPVTCT